MLIAAGVGMEEVDEGVNAQRDADKESNDSKMDGHSDRRKNKSYSLLEITNPFHVELPRSLVEVVIYWNVPTHRWLKNYVFRPAHPIVGAPLAILITYAISALLHGLNFQLAAVLFSLGLYSFVEHKLRSKLARIFDACIAARACRSCRHRNGSHVVWVKLTNLFFGLVSMFHLAYLGVGFDNGEEQSAGYSMNHVMDKWGKLGYASHIVAMAFGVLAFIV